MKVVEHLPDFLDHRDSVPRVETVSDLSEIENIPWIKEKICVEEGEELKIIPKRKKKSIFTGDIEEEEGFVKIYAPKEIYYWIIATIH